METYFFNKEVNVSALYFSNRRGFRAFPKRIEYDGREITFLESGLQYLIHKGQKAIQLFDMTDGEANYRLQLDPEEQIWKLLRVLPAARAKS